MGFFYQMTIDGDETLTAVESQNSTTKMSAPSLIYRTLQKPLGVGIIVGTITGFSNSLILGLPLFSSIAIGGVRIIRMFVWLPRDDAWADCCSA